jgi:hypothetical protein
MAQAKAAAATRAAPAKAAAAAKPAAQQEQVNLAEVPEEQGGEIEDASPADGGDAAMMEEGGEGSQVIDLSEVPEGGGFEVVPRGMYPCELAEITFGNSQRSGNPMWTTVWRVEEGHEYADRQFWYHVVLTPKQFPRVKQFLNRIGRSDLANRPFDPQDVADSGELLGARANLRITIRKYEGEDRNNVQQLMPATAAGEGGSFLDSTSA